MRISDWSSDVCSSDLAGDQAVAVARVGFVARIVARNADEDGGAVAAHLDRRAAGPDVLVVVFEPRNVQIVAEAAARQARDRAADADQVADRRAGRHDRSEEHTSELQSLMRNSYSAFCLKKKKNN